MPGKNYLEDLQVGTLNSQVPAAAASDGVLENPIVYSPRTSFTVDGPDMQGRVVLYEPFSLMPQRVGAADLTVANPHFAIAGTNAATSSQAFTDNGVLITTAGADNDSAIASPVPSQTLWDSDMNGALTPLARFRFKAGASTACRYEFGVRATTTAMDDDTDNDKMIIRFDTSDVVVSAVNFVLVTSNAGVDVKEDTGVALVANRDYVFTLAVNAAREVFLFSCDLAGSATGTDVRCVNNPAAHTLAAVALGTPYGGAKALEVATKAFRLHGFVRSQSV